MGVTFKWVGSFTIKPAVIKQRIVNHKTYTKHYTRMLYAIAKKDNNNHWTAHINTRGLKEFNDVTIFDFTEDSFELKGKREIFLKERDKFGHHVHISRSEYEANNYPGLPEVYSTLREDGVFAGYIVKRNGIFMFDMKKYCGTINNCQSLLEKDYSPEDNDEEKDEE